MMKIPLQLKTEFHKELKLGIKYSDLTIIIVENIKQGLMI